MATAVTPSACPWVADLGTTRNYMPVRPGAGQVLLPAEQEEQGGDHRGTLKQPRAATPGVKGRLVHVPLSLAGVGGQSGQRQTRPTSDTRTSADPRPQFGHRRASALRRAAVTELSVARRRLPS